jgi:hypothetical protein
MMAADSDKNKTGGGEGFPGSVKYDVMRRGAAG